MQYTRRTHPQEGRVGTKDYKTIHAALLFADIKYQVHTLQSIHLRIAGIGLARPCG